ncbi:cysteine-rich repeat secretory protein 1-like isoform X1 [Panicum miliaceum]|uniref:Cysteine-rich repeat secretory protein 1-like isoform X1 n=1 Tax=Panicum miliaceum TaxID=4540 RepID=A0A3L6T7I8_PANMI|nr:cysteine-rich repeat secretory protein 1-like isoform X1 [Panicum miliaceum]
MKNSSLLSLFILAAASPLAATAAAEWSSARVSCGGGGSYAANSTYEANLHHLAAVLPAEANASRRRYAYRALGYWPNRLQADWSCQSSDGDCAACIADAFERVERECPFSREAFFFGRNCTLRLGEYSILGSDVFGRIPMAPLLAIGMMFQAFGLACLFLMFLRAWRHDIKKCTVTRHTPPLSEDQ